MLKVKHLLWVSTRAFQNDQNKAGDEQTGSSQLRSSQTTKQLSHGRF